MSAWGDAARSGFPDLDVHLFRSVRAGVGRVLERVRARPLRDFPLGSGLTFTPDPTGRYAVAETEYQYAPLRIFDLKPALDGTVKTISRPIGAWLAWDPRHTGRIESQPEIVTRGFLPPD